MGALLLLIGVGVAALSWFEPYFADDYASPSVLAQHPALLDLLKHNYLSWSGRETGTFFGWLAFSHPAAYSVLVGVVFLLIAWLVTAIALARIPRLGTREFAVGGLGLAVLWFGMPALGDIAIWRSGSTVYLMTIPLMLGFLLPFRFAISDRGVQRVSRRRGAVLTGLMVGLGLSLGMSHESAIAGTAVVLVSLLALSVRRRITRHLPLHLWAGALAFVVGGVLVVAAPGNQVRAAAIGTGISSLVRLKYLGLVLTKCVSFVLPSVLPWLIIVVLLAWPVSRRQADEEVLSARSPVRWPAIWLAGALGTLLPFAAVPNAAPLRIYAFMFIFLMLAAFSLFASDRTMVAELLPPRARMVGVILLLALVIAEVGGSLLVQRNLNSELSHREALIAEQLANGKTDIVVPALVTQSHRVVPFEDITADADNNENKLFAQYRGLASIRTDQ